LISYEEIKRRLQAPEKMSLRSLAAYTRVSRGPASKKTLLESLNVLGLTPSTTTSVSSSFSKLTEDTRTLCEDMKDFAHDYIDYGNMAKQLIPETNTVQHWSKLIETNHLEEMRKCFKDPVNSGAFENVTHGLGLGMLDVALDMIVMVIDQQIRILSGAAASDPADSTQPVRRIRRRHRKVCSSEKPHTASGGARDQGKSAAKAKTRVRARKKIKPDSGLAGPSETQAGPDKPDSEETNVLTFVSVGYEAVTGGLNA
uniref:Si:ch73-127m5.2 n=1 Tax=Oryzias melastigma TaxID=30732 RepID=A0A3B3BKR2_ORYME